MENLQLTYQLLSVMSLLQNFLNKYNQHLKTSKNRNKDLPRRGNLNI